ncbi:MAG TPA: DUF1552 domain-containing protein [Polyangium sp.]|nr:DUF1552 domain-containing protein [Polyangium sp.]
MIRKNNADSPVHHASGIRGRRVFLRGLGGVIMTLPFLEYFASKSAKAAAPPNRYVFGFGGTSIGFSGGDSVVPLNVGPLKDNLSVGLQPLGDLGVADVVSAISGLYIGWNATPGPGERVIQWHSSTPAILATGLRSALNDNHEYLQGPTNDQIVADLLHAGTDKKVLPYRVQAAYYRGDNGTGGARGTISARIVNGTLEDVPPISSPRVAYQSLFTGFTPPDPQEAEKAKQLLERRKSIIDLVRGDAQSLIPKLGKADQVRMQRHFDELRALELKLDQTAPPMTATCMQLPDPGDDPLIGDAVEPPATGNYTDAYAAGGAYSDEEKRATIMGDLIYMAFCCDLSRVASFMFTYGQCFLNMKPVTGASSDLHEISHYSMGGGATGQVELAKGVAWHVKHWARLIQRLRDTQDSDGSPILDHTALVMTFEGGWGEDPEQGKIGEAHSSENMLVLVGGKAGGLHTSPGQHIKATGRHPCEAVSTAMKAVGIDKPLGEVSGTFDELFT